MPLPLCSPLHIALVRHVGEGRGERSARYRRRCRSRERPPADAHRARLAARAHGQRERDVVGLRGLDRHGPFAVRHPRCAGHSRAARARAAHLQRVAYLLRSNMTGEDPATLWKYYMRLTEIEQAFKELKHDLAIRPIFHQREERIEAHIFVSFLAYSLHVTLKNLARPRAPGLTPRAILEKFSTIQMVDVHLPTTDGRRLVLPRHTRPRNGPRGIGQCGK